MAAFNIRNASNTGWIDASTASGFNIRNATNSGFITSALSKVSVRNATNTGWITFGSPPAPPVTQLTLAVNDLDFYYLPTVVGSDPDATIDVRCTFDTTNFYSKATSGTNEHIVVAIDLDGEQGSNNPHCGPIYRNGRNLWANGRGFIIFQDGSVFAEQWNSTFSPGGMIITNTSGSTFNPTTTPVFTIRLRAGYRSGFYANRMQFFIYEGTNISGAVKFSGEVAWGWDWTGNYPGVIAAIGNNFKKPADSGCIEELLPRADYQAVVPFSDASLAVY